MGAARRKVVDLALNLNRDFFAAYVMSISEDGVLKKELDDGGIPSVCVKKKSKFDIFVVFRIRRFIKKNKIDIVHVFTSTAKLWGRLACMGNKKVVVVSTEESLFRGLRSDVFFERLFNKRTSVIVANSHATMMSAIEKTHISEAKYRVIYNGINLKRFSDYKGNRDSDRHFYKIPADKSVILHIGRFDDRKGHKYLLKAMPLILREKPDAFLVLAGEGETMVSMIELIDELKINEQVLLVGYVADSQLSCITQPMCLFYRLLRKDLSMSSSKRWPLAFLLSRPLLEGFRRLSNMNRQACCFLPKTKMLSPRHI